MNVDDFDEEYAKLRVQYLQRLAELRSELVGAAATADADVALRLAHRLKGSAGSYGFPALGEVAAGVEARLRADAGADLSAALEPLLQSIDQVRG